MAWKKTMHVFHTMGLPPARGSTIRAIIGSTRNIIAALVNTVSANKISFDGIEGIHKEACPNGNCANQTITWSILRQGAQDYYGGNTSNPQYVHFRDRGDEFGVDEDL